MMGESGGDTHRLGPESFMEALKTDDKALLIDVRTAQECAEGIIPHALIQDYHEGKAFKAFVESCDTAKHYYLYCRSGRRSDQAARFMRSRGLTVYDLKGGILSWPGQLV